MSTIIKRYLPRFTFLTLCLLGIGIAIYFAYFENRGVAQALGVPAGFEFEDIGRVGQPGGVISVNPGEVTIGSWGTDIWDHEDSFSYLYQPWSGDGEFTVRLIEMNDTHPRARAGIMIRASLDADAVHAFMTATPRHGMHFLRRTETGGNTADDAHTNLGMTDLEDRQVFQRRYTDLHEGDRSNLNQVGIPRWLRIVRSGDEFSAYDSADGVTWEWLGTESIEMDTDVWVGLAISSRNPKEDCLATFSDFVASNPSAESVTARLLTEIVPGSGDGLMATYYGDRAFDEAVATRVDDRLNFVWNLDSPIDGGPVDHFSVRWEGLLEAQVTEPHLIHLIADEHARLWLDGRLLIDDWFEHAATQTSALVNLEAGRKYHIRVDYIEGRGHAMASLGWSSPSIRRQVIPQSQLYSELEDSDGNQLPDVWEQAFDIQPGQALSSDFRDAVLAARPSRGPSEDPLADASTEDLLREAYQKGRHPAGQAGRTKTIPQSRGWVSLDLSSGGPLGQAEAFEQGKRQQLVATTARYGEVEGRSPAVIHDKFHFAYRPRRGDQEIVARVVGIETASEHTMGGVMVRQSTDPSSPYVAVMVSPTRESWILSRTAPGHGASMQRIGLQAEYLKLQRSGNRVNLFESTDGETWRWLGHEPFVGDAEACYGLAAQGAGMADQSTVEFDDVVLRAYSAPTRTVPPIVGTGDGLKATYTDASNTVERIDPFVDFYWPTGVAPAEGIDEENFTGTWEGELQAQHSEVYTLEIACDDGARLWLDGLLLIDDWRESGEIPRSVRVELTAGRRYPVRLEFYEVASAASARFRWSSPSTVKQVVPQSQLYSTQGAASFSLVGRGDGLRLAQPDEPVTNDSNTFYGPPAPDENETILETVASLDLATFESPVGSWVIDAENGGLLSQSRRGSIEYPFEVTEPGMYLFEIVGEAGRPHPDPNYLLWVDVDGQHLSRRLLTGSDRKVARQLTPWLQPGSHRLKVFWDNTLPWRSLRLREINLQILRGPDTNANTIADWMEEELRRANTVDSPGSSRVSPATIEGRAIYWGLTQASVAGQSFPVSPGAGERWYGSVPLDPNGSTQVELAFENSGLLETHEVAWVATDLTQTEDLTIRQGDSLLFTIGGGGQRWEKTYTVGDADPVVIPEGETVAHQFNEPGHFTITARWRRNDERTIQVTVLAPVVQDNPAALVGQWREWSPPEWPPGVVMDADPLLELGELADTESARYRLRANGPIPRQILVRATEGGSILQRIQVDGFRFDNGNRTGAGRVPESYSDGSLLVEVDALATPLLPQVRFVGRIVAGGVLFASGQLKEEYTAGDFDEVGMITLSFFLPNGSKTSVCHQIDLFQQSEQLNEF